MTLTYRKRTHRLRAVTVAALLALELLATGIQPALGTGEASLTLQFTGNGSGEAVTNDGHIDCAYTNGVVVVNRCSRAGYSAFTKVTLTVTSLTGSAMCDNAFVCHSEGETNVYVIELNGQIVWSAFFGLQNRYIAVLKSGAGSGSVTSADGKINCPASCHQTAEVGYTYGDSVTLHAVPANGSVFSGWSGTCAGQGATCNLTMTDADSESSTTAVFKLTASATPAPTHKPTPGHSVAPGQTQAATSAPATTATPADPGTSVASSDAAGGAQTAGGATATPPGTASAAPVGATVPASTPGSLDSGWIAFLLLLVLVIGVSVGGGIAFIAMRRRAPPAA